MPYPDRNRLGSAAGAGVPGLLSRVVGVVVGAIVLTGALLLSAVLAVVLLAIAAGTGAYLWWRTRDLRRSLRDAGTSRGGPFDVPAHRTDRDATVIEGDFIREVTDDERARRG